MCIMVVKKDNSRESFDRNKIKNGILKSSEKRPVSMEQIEDIIMYIENDINRKGISEIQSDTIGEMVMDKLKDVDEVAYVRFASVYRQFKDINTFVNELKNILIEKGEINQKELRDLRITLNDLQEQLRIKDIYSFDDVEFAIMESNGELSVIPKAGKRNVNLSDLGIKEDEVHLPVVLISDGTIYERNLLKINTDTDRLMNILQKYNLKSYKEVFLAFTDEKKKLHIYVSDTCNNKAKEIAVCEIS